MSMFRPYVLPFAVCIAIEGAIYYGLVGLGAREELVIFLEMIWLCATVVITLSIGQRIERK
jgi:hypothetical protein